jgi:folate-binding protein YgfZ
LILRTEEYRARLVEQRAEWSTYRDAEIVDRFGDPLNEYWAVRDGGLGLADRSERATVVIQGKDTINWLQGLVTNDLMELEKPGSGQRSMAVNQIGRAITDMVLLHVPEMLLMDLEPGVPEVLLPHLRHHIIMENVRAEDRSEQTARMTLLGARSPQLLNKVAFLQHRVDKLTEDLQGSWGEIAGRDVVVQRTPWIGEPAFDISCAREDAHLIWDELMGASDMLRPVGHQALEIMRQEAGYVRFGVDFTEKNIPVEADLNHTINYDKGCYLGQEIIHRLDTRGTPAKMLRVLVPERPDESVEPGQAIEDDNGKKVGEVQQIFVSPQLDDQLFALAYLKRGAYTPGAKVFAAGHPVSVAPLGAPLQMSQAK